MKRITTRNGTAMRQIADAKSSIIGRGLSELRSWIANTPRHSPGNTITPATNTSRMCVHDGTIDAFWGALTAREKTGS